jgi:hypothetical protein
MLLAEGMTQPYCSSEAVTYRKLISGKSHQFFEISNGVELHLWIQLMVRSRDAAYNGDPSKNLWESWAFLFLRGHARTTVAQAKLNLFRRPRASKSLKNGLLRFALPPTFPRRKQFCAHCICTQLASWI